MTQLASFTLQQAVVSALKADSGLLGALGSDRVHDAVPVRAAYPYLVFGSATARDWSTGSSSGQEHIITLTAYSQQPGFRQAYAIADAVMAALENAALNLSGHKVVLLRFNTADFRREPDPSTTRANITFRILTEKL